jgi:Fe-S-cluster containining protein
MSRHARSRLHGARIGWLAGQTPGVMTDEFGKVCGFLRGTPGRRVSCGIYATRPTVCQRYRPGGQSCLDARKELGL